MQEQEIPQKNIYTTQLSWIMNNASNTDRRWLVKDTFEVFNTSWLHLRKVVLIRATDNLHFVAESSTQVLSCYQCRASWNWGADIMPVGLLCTRPWAGHFSTGPQTSLLEVFWGAIHPTNISWGITVGKNLCKVLRKIQRWENKGCCHGDT